MSTKTAKTETTATNPVAAAAKAQRVTLKSQAQVIWDEELKLRSEGAYKESLRPNRDFRQKVLERFRNELGVTTASAATTYNTLKAEAETNAAKEGTDLKLGRDPSIAKPKKKGKPGRPRKAETVVVDEETEAAITKEQAAEEQAAKDMEASEA